MTRGTITARPVTPTIGAEVSGGNRPFHRA